MCLALRCWWVPTVSGLGLLFEHLLCQDPVAVWTCIVRASTVGLTLRFCEHLLCVRSWAAVWASAL